MIYHYKFWYVKSRKPLILLNKSSVCGSHQKIGVTGFEPDSLHLISPDKYSISQFSGQNLGQI